MTIISYVWLYRVKANITFVQKAEHKCLLLKVHMLASLVESHKTSLFTHCQEKCKNCKFRLTACHLGSTFMC